MFANYDDVLQQLQDHGLLVEHLEVDTHKPVRCYERDGDREKRGWYWLSTFPIEGETYIVGSFGIFRGPDPGKTKVQLSKAGRQLTKEQREAIAARHKENARRAKAQREAEASRAAARAAKAWRAYVPEGRSDYLERKGVQAHGLRFDPHGQGTVAVPMMDTGGRVYGLQVIRGKNRGRKREKEYWPKGMSKEGRFFLIGSPAAGGIVLLAEGYATAATLHEATGLPVAVAFDANNLLPVAQALTAAYRGLRVLVCADDDYLQKCKACGEKTPVATPECQHCGAEHGQQNPGIVAAQSAAFAVSGAWVAPTWPADRAGEKLTDFNDLALHPEGGNAAVRAQVEAALEAAGWQGAMQATRSGAPPAPEEGGRRSARSVMSIDELVERYLPIDDGTGKYVFDTWTNRLAHKDQMLAMLPPDAKMADIKRHPVWVSRGAYFLDEVGFDPSGDDPAVKLNTWQGWPLEPRAGECQCILDMLEYLCSQERNADEVYQWLLRWMAYPLQNPGAKMSSAVIMHGPQGTGKSAVFQTLARIYGDYATVLNQRGLEDRFNADWAENKLFILAEEVVTRQEMWHIKNELKELVTGEWIRVNPKNVAAYRQRNQINIAYLSNEGQPLPLENDDRRHLVVWTPPQLHEEWYDQLWAEIENGGVEAFYHYLLHEVDLTDWHPKKRPPMTASKEELIHLSKQSEDRFVEEWMAGETPHPFSPCTSQDLYTAYQRWCRANGVRYPAESHKFLGKVKKMEGWVGGRRYVYDSTWCNGQAKQRSMVIPPDPLLRQYGHPRPEDKTQAQWLTEELFEFRKSLQEGADRA